MNQEPVWAIWPVHAGETHMNYVAMQVDDDPESTERVPIVLPGLRCRGSEKSVDMCTDFDIGLDVNVCSHASDVHLVCFSGSNPGTSTTSRRTS